MNLFGWIPGYTDGIYNEGKEPLFLLFIAFLATFFLTRLYTRLARVYDWGSASAGGVHMHHMVPGVILMAICGGLGFTSLYDNGIAAGILAIGFGIGTALTFDEFAMIFHVRDVYWSDEGRTSIHAMLMGMALAGLLLVGFAPLDFDHEREASGGAGVFLFVTLSINAALAILTFLKGKQFFGVAALLIPTVGVWSSIRLAKPTSPWARWFYDPDRGSKLRRKARERKLRRSEKRFTYGRYGRFERWFTDFIGGSPTAQPPPLDSPVEH